MLNILLIAVALIGIGNSGNLVKTYSGKALNQSDDKFLYREIHEAKFNGEKIDEIITQFKDPNNNLIAVRTMIFGEDLTKPQFVLKDFRSGYVEGSELLPSNKVRVYTKENFGDKLDEKILEVEEPFVIDGGITYFFKEHWEDLIRNKTVKFNFVTPSKLDYYRFRVYKKAIVQIDGRKGLQLVLELDNFIMRAFVDPIIITYDLENKEILYYKGISNINDENGKSLSIKIDYSAKGNI